MRTTARHDRGESALGTVAAVLGIVGALLGILLTVIQLGALGSFRFDFLPSRPGEATLSVDRGSGPSGTRLVFSGQGFGKNETVEIRFHTDLIATVRTDGDGAFVDARARVPGSFDVFAPQTFEITASGRSSAQSARVPFSLTKR